MLQKERTKVLPYILWQKVRNGSLNFDPNLWSASNKYQFDFVPGVISRRSIMAVRLGALRDDQVLQIAIDGKLYTLAAPSDQLIQIWEPRRQQGVATRISEINTVRTNRDLPIRAEMAAECILSVEKFPSARLLLPMIVYDNRGRIAEILASNYRALSVAAIYLGEIDRSDE